MRDIVFCILASLIFLVSQSFSPAIAHSAVITVINLDGGSEGFNDPSAPDAASTAGGNGGSTLGAQRLIAFQRAADIWARFIGSPVEITVDANFDPLSCTSTSATLGSAGTRTVHRDFVGALIPNTWYPQSLANSLAGSDLSASSDIAARFNSAIGTTCPFPLIWYYGLDGNPPGGGLDFLTVVLHELAHGLGFQSFVDLESGRKLLGLDDVMSLNLEDHSTGRLYPQMTDEERVTASRNNGNLHWVGANVVAGSGSLAAGVHQSGHVQMYAPSSQQPGSSVSHFDTAVAPNELMEPSYTSVLRNLELTVDLLADLGWVTLSGFADVDFDGDGKADIAIYRNGAWFILNSSGGSVVVGWGGAAQDIPVQADYDGDGKSDVAVFRDGVWFIVRSSGGTTVIGWGEAGDVPVSGDYDGDGKADQAVYRNGAWFIRRSSDSGMTVVGWGGVAGDIPVPADYDGDGKTDVAIYRSGAWFIVRTSGGTQVVGWGGVPGDILVPADYDGDGKTDVAIYRSGTWFIVRSSGGTQVVGWGGAAQDVPVPADYDGDGNTDVAVFRDGAWFIANSSGGTQVVGWGVAGDIPLN